MRALGRLREAADLVALQCEWPPRVTVREYALVSSLDLRRWLAAYTGRPWDGIPASMRSARDAATRRRRGQAPAAGTRVPTAGGVYKQYCTSHLLVEPLDNNPHAEQLADYTLDVGWPSYFMPDPSTGRTLMHRRACIVTLCYCPRRFSRSAERTRGLCVEGRAARKGVCCPAVGASCCHVTSIASVYAGRSTCHPSQNNLCGYATCGWVGLVARTAKKG